MQRMVKNTDELQANDTKMSLGVDPERLWQTGADLHRKGQREAALAVFERLRELTPDNLALLRILAALYLDLKLPRAALQAAQCALQLAPEDAESHFNLAVVAAELEQFADAEAAYTHALKLNPRHYGVLCNLPALLSRRALDSAASHYAALAVEAYPDDVWLHYNRGDVMLSTGDAESAEQAYRRALALEPEFHRARYALSIAVAAQGDVRRAYAERRAALAAEPELLQSFPSPLALDEGVQGGDLRPERIAITAAFSELRTCTWSRFDAITAQYAALARGEEGNPPLSQPEMPYLSLSIPLDEGVRRQVARQAAALMRPPADFPRPLRPPRPPDRRLHIGYISADFRPHPVPMLMGNLYARHDRGRFKVHAYALGPVVDSPQRARVQNGADVFRDIEGMPPPVAAQIIANDGIDILVDLSGYTRHTRPEVLALKPAPLQVSYLGYVATLGAEWIDYALLDHNALLPEARAYWDEKIAYLPGSSYHCEMPQALPSPPARAALGLPETALVLGALHHPRKLEPYTWGCWMDILKALPQAVLWLLCETEEQKINLARNAATYGIGQERLVFAEGMPHADHISRMQQIDIFLDTFIYNGHTTTIDALSAGVPVVSYSGQSVVSRIAGSMLKAHGLPELVAESMDEYKHLVLKLAGDSTWRMSLRERIRDYSNSNLFCPERKLAQIETAYEMMWARHQAGLPPEDFDVPRQ